jgi:MFS family permease
MGARKGPHPALFAILVAPYGAAFSYVAIALPFLGGRVGMAVAMTALLGLAYVPHAWKFLWAPLVDTTLTRKAWYWISLALTAGGLVLMSSVPVSEATLGVLSVVVVVSQVGLTLLNMAVESFMALGVPEDGRGRAAGWYWFGNLFAGALAGPAMLSLLEVLPQPWMAGAIVGSALLLCGIPTFFIVMPPRDADHPPHLAAAMRRLGRDLLGLVTSRAGLTGLVICLVPVSAGVMTNALNSMNGMWGIVDPGTYEILGMRLTPTQLVGYVMGGVGGVLGAVGAILGGQIADRMPRRLAQALAGGLMALTAVIMAFAPRDPWAYVAFGLTYAFFSGVAQAAFSSFVLETIGKGAVATKYNIFASLTNQAYAYTAYLDSRALAAWGATGMLLSDAALTCFGIVVVLAMFFLVTGGRSRPAVTSPSA